MKVISCHQVKFEVRPNSPHLVCTVEDVGIDPQLTLLVTNVVGDRHETTMSGVDHKGNRYHFKIVPDVEEYNFRQLVFGNEEVRAATM